MALDAGNAACTTGLSKRIYDKLAAKWAPYVPTQEWKDVCHAAAEGVVDEIKANAALSGAVATISAGGLQRDNTAGNPATLAPVVPVTVPVTGGIT
jgi:hypothetical protein